MRSKPKIKNVALGALFILSWTIVALTYIAVTCNIAVPNKNGAVWTLHNNNQSAIVYVDIALCSFILLTINGVDTISRMRRKEKIRLWLLRRYANRPVRPRNTEGAPQ